MKKAPTNISVHPWRKLLVVNDGLILELKEVQDGDKEKMFLYQYTEQIDKERPTTKIGMNLPMFQSQIETNLRNEIFKIHGTEETNT